MFILIFIAHAGEDLDARRPLGCLFFSPLVALIMHTDKLLLVSDLLFQKVGGGNVQGTLPMRVVRLHFREIS